LAAALGRATFTLGGVVINEIVFELDEPEDLTPFQEKEVVAYSEEENVENSINFDSMQLNES
jgi:hypothetical protein